MADANLEIKISANADGARKGINDVSKAVDDIAPAHAKAAAAAEDGGRRTGQAAQRASGDVGALGEAARAMGAQLAAAFTFKELVAAAATMEQLQAGMQAVSGSSEQAGKDMEFVRAVAGRIGTDVAEAGRAFLGLAAATKGTAVEGEPTRQVFEAVASAMGKAGKSSAETGNALQALSQMASKGVVQSEELRGQLGEALPGALNAASKGLGLTTAELMKLVEEGKITANDLFPALASGLNELYGGAPQAQTLSQEFANVKNAFVEMADNIGQSGGLSALKVGAEVAQMAIALLGEGLVATGKKIGAFVAAVVNWDFSQLKTTFAEIEADAQKHLLKAAQHNETLAKTLGFVSTEAVKAQLAQQQTAQATAQAGAAAAKAGDDWIKLNNGYGLVLESVREQIAQAEKSVIARDAEGKASIALAQAFGTEKEQRDAAAAASAANAAALKDLAAQRLTELETMKAQLASLQAEAKERGNLDDARKKQMAELEKQIGLRQQDAEKAVAQAQTSRLVAEQAKAEAEAVKDNSARVAELRDAYEKARAKVEELRAAKAAGKATTEDVTKAELEAGKAALLYRDALNDQLKAINARASAQRADLDVQAASVQLAIEQQRTILEVARARGDEAGAMRAQESIRRLEIELLELSAQAKYAEADAAIATAQAKKAELIASGEYIGVKKLEIDAAIKSAEVKRMQGQIAQETANRLRQLGDAQGDLKNKTEDATGSLLRQAGALERLGDGVERVGEGFRNKDGFTSDAKGNVQQQFVWTRSSIIDYLKQAGLAQELAERLSKDFVNGQGNVSYEASAAQLQWGGKHSTLAEALGKMAEYYKYNDSGKHEAAQMLDFERGKSQGGGTSHAGNTSAPQGRSGTGMATGAGSSKGSGSGVSAGAGSTFVSNITIDGQRTSVNFADRGSQQAAEQLLRQLAQAKGVAQ